MKKGSRAIILYKSNILLMYREIYVEGTRKRFYVTIGGGVEEGETFEEALHRECYEEAGIEVEIVDLIMQFKVNGEDNERKVSNIYFCNCISETYISKPQINSPEGIASRHDNTYEIHEIERNNIKTIPLLPLSIKEEIISYGIYKQFITNYK